jgi:hypothetical protein
MYLKIQFLFRKVIEPGMLVGGVPAKVIRRLSSENIERAKEGALQYVDMVPYIKKRHRMICNPNSGHFKKESTIRVFPFPKTNLCF